MRTGGVLLAVMLALGAGLHSVAAGAQQYDGLCGSLANQYGPFDYRRDKHKLGVVERHHFDANVESLRKGRSSAYVGSDIDYTLRAFPNHHRALMSMMRLGAKEKVPRPRGANFTVECYFVRAERFRPDDSIVKMIHGLYLMGQGKNADAIEKFEQARASEDGNANLHYNLGLAYAELKQFDKALDSAHRAYALGFPLPGLRDKLVRAGRWRQPEAAVSPPPVQSDPAVANEGVEVDVPSDAPR